jgi:hypothetical protein
VRHTLLAAMIAGVVAAAPLPAPLAGQDDLSGVLSTLAGHWARGNASAIAALAAEGGIELEVQGASLGRVSGRKAAAAFRHMFGGQETVSVQANMTSRVTGTDNTAFGELIWEVRPRGSMVPARSTVFLGLVREGPTWRVSQIRVLR